MTFSAEFFAPPTAIRPDRRRPPVISNRSTRRFYAAGSWRTPGSAQGTPKSDESELTANRAASIPYSAHAHRFPGRPRSPKADGFAHAREEVVDVRTARLIRLAAVVAALTALALVPAPGAQAGPTSCYRRNNDTIKKLLECMTVEGVRGHQAELQDIADANDDTRVSGSEGYNASADYVANTLEGVGYEVTRQEFDFNFFEEFDSAFEQISPNPTVYEDQVDYDLMQYSGPGDVTALIQPVDVMIPPGPNANDSTSGCEDSDFAGFVAGRIALMQRGTCGFGEKVANAAEASAAGAVIFNEGQPGRTALFFGTLGSPQPIPAVGTGFALGEELYTLDQAGDVTVRIFADTISEVRTTENVIAESRFGNDDNVVMAGSHLDSVPEGPGINDNGSGSSALLETAILLRKLEPVNTVRFAWWGAEESGLLGSLFYVNSLTEDQVDDIALYLNFDMIGSPNGIRMIYDGDNSLGQGANPPGSEDIEALFQEFFDDQGLAYEDTEIGNRSDHAGFRILGIPIGGLFTGAEVPKTAAQAVTYGGTAGAQLDPCYHQACDTFEGTGNELGLTLLGQNADAVAFAILTYSYDTSSVG
jgi:Zn-dependent M28 family amino/carboxypeptidase